MKPNFYSTIRRIILTCMILVPFIPFVLILGTGYYYFAHSLESSTIARMQRIIDDHRQMIEAFLNERRADLEFVQNAYSFQELSRAPVLKTIFELLKKESNAFIDLGIFDESGMHIAYEGPYELKGKIYSHTDWFKNVMQQGYYISDVFLGYRNIPHFIIATVRKENGRKWVIRATIDTVMFNNLVKQVRMGATGESYILNAAGMLQTERRSGGKLMDREIEHQPRLNHHEGTKIFIEKEKNKHDYLYATTWMKNGQWQLVVRQRKTDAFQHLRTAAYLIMIISVVGGALICGVAFYLTNRIVRRMEQLGAERDQLTEQLIRAGRLAELGEMSAGFAHEINNPLQIIKNERSLIEVLVLDLKEKAALKDSVEVYEIEDSLAQINLQISRCAEITQAILKFGRKSESAWQDVDLRIFLPEVVAMIAKKARVNGISVNQNISNALTCVYADPAQLQQVFLNLFNNAIDAINERHGGSGGEISIVSGTAPDNRVRILVKDNGCGISAENLNKIFSPFFTTKPVGKGTGLGLSICFGIISNMGGTMEAESEPGKGTAFTIHLPAAHVRVI